MTHLLRTSLFIAALACAGGSLAAARADESADAQQEHAALLAFFRQQGIDLRPAENRSNVISYMYSVGPEHTMQYLIGLTYHPRTLSAADVMANYPIALPYVIHQNWVLWQVGGPRGNVAPDYLAAWEKVRSALKDYRLR